MVVAKLQADIFMMAFKSLTHREKTEILRRFLSDKEFREDLMDIVVFEARRHEISRPINEYLESRKNI